MEHELQYNTPIFKDELTETPHFRCGWCGEDTTDESTRSSKYVRYGRSPI